MNRTRLEKIAFLAETYVAAGITPGMASRIAEHVLMEIFPPLLPIDIDKSMDRRYIPLPGDYEIQTKGNGSTFRIAAPEEGDRMPITGGRFEHEFITEMALNIRSAYGE